MIENEIKISLINSYYNLVDNIDINVYRKLYELYDNNIEYNRAGKIYIGIDELKYFFENRFSILSIKHNVKNIKFFDNGDIFVEGSFEGYKKGNSISGNFIDIFKIKNLKIVFRKTYLIVNEKNSGIIQID